MFAPLPGPGDDFPDPELGMTPTPPLPTIATPNIYRMVDTLWQKVSNGLFETHSVGF